MASEGKTVACLVSKETDTAEYEAILKRLEQDGISYVIIAPDQESLEQICLAGDCPVACGLAIGHARNMVFDGLLIPDGKGVDAFLHEDVALDFLRHYEQQKRPLAAIGRGILLLVGADLVDNRHVAAPEALRADVEAMGGIVVPAPYFKELQGDNWITARGADQAITVADALSCAIQDWAPAKGQQV